MTVIDEFAKELHRRAAPSASWFKVDLHNHSPASHDFRGSKDTAVADYATTIRERRLSVVMFTDHERLPEQAFVSALAAETGALVLAGLEVNVFVDAFDKPADKVGKELCFHLLIGFDPEGANTPSYWVEELYRHCRLETRSFGNTSMRGVNAPIEQIADVLRDSGAFIIPAHLHSGKDAFKSRSVDVVYSSQQFLRWTKQHFTALDVRSDATASFFDGKHEDAQLIEISCIRTSDAHEATQLGTNPTWVQMERVSFAELKAALELPSRVSRSEPMKPSSFVEGLCVEGQFLQDFWMKLSPNLNVLIGVKGSGKTSVLECLRFVLGSEVPSDRRGEVDKHLGAILGPAGRARALLRRDDGARVLVDRHITDRKFRVTFEDDREAVFDNFESIRFPASILGWHEIEHAATERQLRRLHMDAIAGREDVKRLTDEAMVHALSIRHRHETAAAKYSEYVQLAATVRNQEEMRDGLQQLQGANLIELRDQMANALADRQEIERLRQHLADLPTQIPSRVSAVLQVDQFKFGTAPPLQAEAGDAATTISDLRQLASSVELDLSTASAEAVKRVSAICKSATDNFDRFATDYAAKLAVFPPEVQRLLESHREVLEKTKDLPNLRARLVAIKEEIGEALQILADTAEMVATALDKRLELRQQKVSQFNDRLADAGVQLTVVPGAARDDEFAPTFSNYAQVREVFHQLRALHAGAGRFHRTLSASYRDLRNDLVSGNNVLFSRAEFGHLITVLENDDLDIRFAVGKPGELFSPIDQLSAGQRCTAVFPILLKLKEGPLIIDQPEDNLDNRHIARAVAPTLVSDKRTRQILLTSHNANLVVLSDPECIAEFEAHQGRGNLIAAGFLSHRGSPITARVLDILDGGERALELRTRKYGAFGRT